MHIHKPFFDRLSDERGQVILFVIIAFIVLTALVGVVVDVGYAYRTQRNLQSAADAAALAGAQELPDSTMANSMATQYGASSSGNNKINGVASTETVTTACITTIPGCSPVNSVTVSETANVPTFFSRILGFNSFKIKVKATACSPCGSKPVDVMLVLDRTGSMCQDSNGNNDPSCTDLNNAKQGIRTFLSFFDPNLAWVGLAVLPPAHSVANKCSTPNQSDYNLTTSAYTIVPMSHDYKNPDNSLNTSSNLISTLNCIQGGGSTSYANAIESAQAELNAHGRAGVSDVIVFLSDGAANTGPSYYATNSPYRTQPCHQGVTSAGLSKAAGVTVYSIGYALNDATGGCTSYTGAAESPAITVYQALGGIATNSSDFYVQPNPGSLQGIYTQIAQDISHGSSSLIG